MSKQGIIFYAVLVLLVLFVGQNFLHTFEKYQDQIDETKKELREMTEARDKLLKLVEEKNQKQQETQREIDQKEGTIAQLRSEKKALQEQYAKERAFMCRLIDDEASMAKFREIFPRFQTQAKSVELTEVIDIEGIPTEITHNRVFMPVAYLDEFVRVALERASLAKQMEKMVLIDEVQEEIKSLKDEMFKLEREKSVAYQEGYEKAFEMFSTTQEKYLKVLKEKRFANIFQAIGGFVAGAALGVNF